MGFSASVISNRILQVSASVGDAAFAALESEAERILTESKEEVPLDTGDLMRSGFVEMHGTEAWIRYPLEYAAKQHEEPAYGHTRGRKWKYLEDPLKRNRKQVIREIADGIAVVLRG